jgi:hypothetical protein
MPTRGECSGCLRAPVPRYRFNVVVEDRLSQRKLTQLLCSACLYSLVGRLVSQSVEKTPQRELDDLSKGVPLPEDEGEPTEPASV